LALPILQVLLGFRYEPAAYYQGLPGVWTNEARSKGFGFPAARTCSNPVSVGLVTKKRR
jgi:hypothetical protein